MGHKKGTKSDLEALINKGQFLKKSKRRASNDSPYNVSKNNPLLQKCTKITFRWFMVLSFFMFIFYIFLLVAHPWVPNFRGSFVSVKYPHMIHECRPYYIAGFNLHNSIEIALLHPSHYTTHKNKVGKQLLHDIFDQAAFLGLNTVRIWAHSNNPKFPFQKAPGQYASAGLHALDYTVGLAKQHGMKVIISFIDNWKYYNGVDQYVDWSQTAPEREYERFKDPEGDFHPYIYEDKKQRRYENKRHSLFYSDQDAMQIYKMHVHAIVTRVNPYTGNKYGEDPTIMAWDLINEPRCQGFGKYECAQKLNDWYQEMSRYVKSLDPNHLVTTGEEGFWGANHQRLVHNPDTWGELLGQDFVSNHNISDIDFASVHVWPNNWNRSATTFQRDWILEHVVDAEINLRKPVLIEEFGRRLFPQAQHAQGIREQRDPAYLNIYNIVENAIRQGRPISGSLFWRLFYPTYAGEKIDGYGVRMQDSTAKIIRDHARSVNLLMNAVPPKIECGLECWVPTADGACELQPTACEEYFKNPTESARLFYTSHAECCFPVRGAYMTGCKTLYSLV
eukprot:TRINITY_DN6319_c0_g1_i1.p2 TRINITY_DN6319_c0_g1~~TRINITY_DN6319_c0_g1_i1.p2  ORF type:complete len:561 (-),score=32.64 TRINITY_DN6319_c0_g1_i1:264-1946(-)